MGADITGKTLMIAGENRKRVLADARIVGDQVELTCPEIEKPVAVRCGFTMFPSHCNLYNKYGLPASTFRTDGWPTGWGPY